MNPTAKHYDLLIDDGQDPVFDPEPLKEYMNKWDGDVFIEEMCLDKTKSVLEIGVGTGRIAVKVVPLCKKFTGIDISEKTINKAKENLGNVNLICCDFLKYEFSEKFDVIYSSLTFLHIAEKQKAFDIASSVLNDNGRFVLSIDKNQDDLLDAGISKIRVFPDNPTDIKNYAKKSFLKLLKEYETEFAYIFVFSVL